MQEASSQNPNIKYTHSIPFQYDERQSFTPLRGLSSASVGFETLAAVSMKICIFCVMKQRSNLKVSRRFGAVCPPHLQGHRIIRASFTSVRSGALTALRCVTDDRTHQCTIYTAYNSSKKCSEVRKILSSSLNKTLDSDLDVTSPG
jgi:hypothetical protein